MLAREKIERTIEVTERHLERYARPGILSSFGKESLVMLHLFRHLRLPVVVCRPAHFLEAQWELARRTMVRWGLAVTWVPPADVRLEQRGPEALVLVSDYALRPGCVVQWVQRVEPAETGCIIDEALSGGERGEGAVDRDVLLCGQKTGDDNFAGERLPRPPACIRGGGGLDMLHPLRDWSDDDVWDYIERQEIPVDRFRYDVARRREWPATERSNDRVRLCAACVDPRNAGGLVFCPKLGAQRVA